MATMNRNFGLVFMMLSEAGKPSNETRSDTMLDADENKRASPRGSA